MQKITVPLLRSVPLNKDVFQFDFGWGETPVEFKAGQFFMLEVADEAGKVNRSYSVSSAPSYKEGFSLCVKLLADGRGSKLLRELPVGGAANFMAPFGHFVLADSTKDILMIATGTGLAPYMGMLPTLFEQGFAGQITLIFGVRHEEDLFYVEKLRAWEKDHSNFKAIITLSQPSEEWTGEKGRVTDHLEGFDWQNVQVYICGNGDMVKAVKGFMDEKGVPKLDIHLEQFTTI
jgi:ferredoxin-NADP reductase